MFLPFYRTRRFWAIIYSLMLVWSVFFYITSFPLFREGYWLFFDLSSVLGAGIFLLIFNGITGIILSSLFLLTLCSTAYTTLVSKAISLKLNMFVLVVYIINMVVMFMFLGGLT